jgi:excisionase family DNA binding protein
MSAELSPAVGDAVVNPDPLLDLAQAAAYLGLRLATMREHVHRQRVEVIRLHGAVRVRRSVLDDWIARGTTPAVDAPPAYSARSAARRAG